MVLFLAELEKFFYAILLPPLVLCAFYKLHVHQIIFQALYQYNRLNSDEKTFIYIGICTEVAIDAAVPLLAYITAIVLGKITNDFVSATVVQLLVILLMTVYASNSFENGNERTNMRRIESVSILILINMAVYTTAALVLIFDHIFIHFLPIPLRHLDLRRTYEVPYPKWFTLSKPLFLLLPEYAFIAVMFYVATFSINIWLRLLHYMCIQGFLPRRIPEYGNEPTETGDEDDNVYSN